VPIGIACEHALHDVRGTDATRVDEEVAPVRNTLIQRSSALPAACALVLELPPIAAAKAAHVLVGYGAAATKAALGATLTRSQWLTQEAPVQINGTSGFAAKQIATGMDPVGGVRGIPPRGWPV